MIKYYIVSRKNPLNKSEKYYAQLQTQHVTDVTELTDKIVARCTLTKPDVQAAIAAFEEEVIAALLQGRSVKIGSLGCFRPSLASTGSMDKEGFTSKNIKRVKVRFTPSSIIRKTVQPGMPGVSFQLINPKTDEVVEEGGV